MIRNHFSAAEQLYTQSTLPNSQKWTPKPAKTKQWEILPLSGKFRPKSSSHLTSWILCSCYSGLNIAVVSAMLCFQLWQPHSSHLQHFLPISSHVRWDKKGESSATLEGAPTVIKLTFFYKATEVFEIWGLSRRSGISHPNPSTHPRNNTWRCKSEHSCSIRKLLLELPKWPVPFVLPKERATPPPVLLIRGASA